MYMYLDPYSVVIMDRFVNTALVTTLLLFIVHYRLSSLPRTPTTMEHETAASGDTYAVVDKPRRSSKKTGGPEVVPPPSEGVSGAVLSRMRLLFL